MPVRHLSIAVSLLALTACASSPMTKMGKGRLTQEDVAIVSSETSTDGLDPIATAAFWGTRYDRDPMNAEVAVNFSRSLRALDNNDEALRVMSQTAQRAGDDPHVQLEYGKALIANERAHEAVRPIEQAIANGLYEDWSAYSAYGVALDKTGRHEAAREQYDRALTIAPDAAQVLNNKGLSYALQGRAAMAERTLRTATAAPGGNARVRQNLALVLAMAGNTGEAEMLARSDLPPRVADNNVAYFRGLTAQPAYWGGLSTQNAELPVFDDEPQGPVEPTYEPAPPLPLVPQNEVPAFEPVKGEPAEDVQASAPRDDAVVAIAAPTMLNPTYP